MTATFSWTSTDSMSLAIAYNAWTTTALFKSSSYPDETREKKSMQAGKTQAGLLLHSDGGVRGGGGRENGLGGKCEMTSIPWIVV